MMRPENINSPETKTWTKNPAETTGVRYKNVNLMSRTQKRMGSVGCFGQIEIIKRQAQLYYVSMVYCSNPYNPCFDSLFHCQLAWEKSRTYGLC